MIGLKLSNNPASQAKLGLARVIRDKAAVLVYKTIQFFFVQMGRICMKEEFSSQRTETLFLSTIKHDRTVLRVTFEVHFKKLQIAQSLW